MEFASFSWFNKDFDRWPLNKGKNTRYSLQTSAWKDVVLHDKDLIHAWPLAGCNLCFRYKMKELTGETLEYLPLYPCSELGNQVHF